MSQENVELVRRFYAAMPGLRAANPDEDQASRDRLFRDHLDERWEMRMPTD